MEFPNFSVILKTDKAYNALNYDFGDNTAMNAISINFKSAPLNIRSLFAFTKEEQADFFKSAFNSLPFLSQCVIVSTCNRCELYFDGEINDIKKMELFLCHYKGTDFEKSLKYFNIYNGEAAVSHLLKVACGITSMVLGEDEILRQIKDAYYFALKQKAVLGEFNTIFKMAITAAKDIKTVTGLSQTPVSIGTLAANEVFSFPKENKTVLIIGATGKIGSITAKNIASKEGIKIIGTSKRYNKEDTPILPSDIKMHSFYNRYDFTDEADIIISATSSPHYTITKDELLKSIKTKKERLFIDLAVPRDIDSSVVDIEGCKLYDMDHFKELSKNNNFLKHRQADSAAEYVEKWKDEIIKELTFRHIIDNMESLEKITDKRSIKHLIYSIRKLANKDQTESIDRWLEDYIKEWSR